MTGWSSICCSWIPNKCVGTTCKTQYNYIPVCVFTRKANGSVFMELMLALLPRSSRFFFYVEQVANTEKPVFMVGKIYCPQNWSQNICNWWATAVWESLQIHSASMKGRMHRGKNCSAILSWELIFIKRPSQFPTKQPNE